MRGRPGRRPREASELLSPGPFFEATGPHSFKLKGRTVQLSDLGGSSDKVSPSLQNGKKHLTVLPEPCMRAEVSRQHCSALWVLGNCLFLPLLIFLLLVLPPGTPRWGCSQPLGKPARVSWLLFSKNPINY